jgi:RNA polymerase sigma-70 factor (ECF subfamily)
MELTEFKSVFDRHYDPVKNFLYYKLGDIDLAEDLVQEVFLKAWEKRDSIQMETIQNLLYTIASHLAINHFNSAKARFEFRLKDQSRSTQESPQYILEKDEFALQLEKAIAALPENQRIVFLMNRIDELTYKEIAERLEISVKAVEKRMHEALEELRKTIAHKF